MELTELFQFAFIQRALIVGVVIGATLALFSPLVVVRKMAFFGEGIAHASLTGIAIGLVVGWQPVGVAIVFGAMLAIIMDLIERTTRLTSDTIIGIFFSASMAIGVILLSVSSGYQPDLLGFLFGNILAIRISELWLTGAVAVVIGLFYYFYRKQLFLRALDPDTAALTGVRTVLVETLFRVLLAILVVISVKVIGIVLVSALLVLPAATAKLMTRSLKALTIMTFVVSEIVVIGGLLLSFVLDWPSGATIIVFGTTVFLLTVLLRPLLNKQ